MPVKVMKPYTPGRRGMVVVDNSDLYKGRPKAALVESMNRKAGRNNQGRITVRHRGSGVKRLYRVIDFKRQHDNVPAKVVRLEYDPNRSARLALLSYADGQFTYILANKGVQVGDVLHSGVQAPIRPGNTMPLTHIPVGSTISCIEMVPGAGAKFVRSAGGFAQLIDRDSKIALIELRSGERRTVPVECRATLGAIGNSEHSLQSYGTAGRRRRLGWRPTVRGVAMNPVDHPHGGGEGRTSGGRPSCSYSGVLEGKRTRKKKKYSNKFIVLSRHKRTKKGR